MKKIQYYTLRIFLIMTFLCASTMLFMIWRGGPDEFDIVNRLALTFFIAGLFSFLVWITSIVIEIKNSLLK
ncbi:MAG: hypothetical protein WC095_00215 [Candidatus Paceibacterota bacterium]